MRLLAVELDHPVDLAEEVGDLEEAAVELRARRASPAGPAVPTVAPIGSNAAAVASRGGSRIGRRGGRGRAAAAAPPPPSVIELEVDARRSTESVCELGQQARRVGVDRDRLAERDQLAVVGREVLLRRLRPRPRPARPRPPGPRARSPASARSDASSRFGRQDRGTRRPRRARGSRRRSGSCGRCDFIRLPPPRRRRRRLASRDLIAGRVLRALLLGLRSRRRRRRSVAGAGVGRRRGGARAASRSSRHRHRRRTRPSPGTCATSGPDLAVAGAAAGCRDSVAGRGAAATPRRQQRRALHPDAGDAVDVAQRRRGTARRPSGRARSRRSAATGR